METVSVCSTDVAPAMSLVQLGGRPVQPATLLPIVSFMQNSPAKTGRVMGMPVPAGMGCLHLCTAGCIDTATLKQHVQTSFPIPCACWEAHMQGCKENQVFLFFASSKERRRFCFACLCSETRTQASGKYCISCSVAFFWLCAEQGHSTVLPSLQPWQNPQNLPSAGPRGQRSLQQHSRGVRVPGHARCQPSAAARFCAAPKPSGLGAGRRRLLAFKQLCSLRRWTRGAAWCVDVSALLQTSESAAANARLCLQAPDCQHAWLQWCLRSPKGLRRLCLHLSQSVPNTLQLTIAVALTA